MRKADPQEDLGKKFFEHLVPVVQQFLLGGDTSRAARRGYRHAVKRWTRWAQARGYTALPARPNHLAEYFADCERTGVCFGTMRVYAVAIAMYHRQMGLRNPLTGPALLVLERQKERSGDGPDRIDGLTRRHLRTIKAKVLREYRHWEGPGSAPADEDERRRVLTDIALLTVMRDARLRPKDTATLMWKDITEESDGTGVVRVRCTDAESEHDILRPIEVETMQALWAMRRSRERLGNVFDLDECGIDRRIGEVAQRAGLEGNFNGDSPRLGKALDQVLDGLGLEEATKRSSQTDQLAS